MAESFGSHIACSMDGLQDIEFSEDLLLGGFSSPLPLQMCICYVKFLFFFF